MFLSSIITTCKLSFYNIMYWLFVIHVELYVLTLLCAYGWILLLCQYGHWCVSVFWYKVFFILHLFTCREDAAVAVPAVETPAPALGEPMDIMTALQLVLRKSKAHGGLARGLHEGAKVIEKHAAQLCVLAEDCDQPDYVKLVKGLCADHNVSLITVPNAKTLGEWAGVSNSRILSCGI